MSDVERWRIEAGAQALQLFTTGTTNAWRQRYWMERSHSVLEASGYADDLRAAVEAIRNAENLLSGALEPGAIGKPVREFTRGEMADIETALAALRAVIDP
jgi:hypothetical protein